MFLDSRHLQTHAVPLIQPPMKQQTALQYSSFERRLGFFYPLAILLISEIRPVLLLQPVGRSTQKCAAYLFPWFS
jgi:hypothetical protein